MLSFIYTKLYYKILLSFYHTIFCPTERKTNMVCTDSEVDTRFKANDNQSTINSSKKAR